MAPPTSQPSPQGCRHVPAPRCLGQGLFPKAVRSAGGISLLLLLLATCPLCSCGTVPLKITLVPVDKVAVPDEVQGAIQIIEDLLLVNLPLLSPAREWGADSAANCYGEYVPYGYNLKPDFEGEIKLAFVGNYSGGLCSTSFGGSRLAFANTCVVQSPVSSARDVIAGFIVVCPVLAQRSRPLMKGVLVHEIFHALGFTSLPNSQPGAGRAAVAQARKLLGCDDVKVVPCNSNGEHWDPALVGTDEVMTPCMSQNNKMYVSSLTVAAMVDTGRFSSRKSLDSPSSSWEWRGTSGCNINTTVCVGDLVRCPCFQSDFYQSDGDGNSASWSQSTSTWVLSLASCLLCACCALSIRLWMTARPNGTVPDIEQSSPRVEPKPYGGTSIGVVCFSNEPFFAPRAAGGTPQTHAQSWRGAEGDAIEKALTTGLPVFEVALQKPFFDFSSRSRPEDLAAGAQAGGGPGWRLTSSLSLSSTSSGPYNEAGP